MTPAQETALTIGICLAYGLMLLSLPFLDTAGRILLERWIDHKHAQRRAALEAIERRHQAADGRLYGEE
jgi:hypothetical protein